MWPAESAGTSMFAGVSVAIADETTAEPETFQMSPEPETFQLSPQPSHASLAVLEVESQRRRTVQSLVQLYESNFAPPTSGQESHSQPDWRPYPTSGASALTTDHGQVAQNAQINEEYQDDGDVEEEKPQPASDYFEIVDSDGPSRRWTYDRRNTSGSSELTNSSATVGVRNRWARRAPQWSGPLRE